MPRGGYRQPENPSPVSLPGALSSRTDGGAIEGMQPAQVQAEYTGMPYGENKSVNDQQSQAPMAATAPTPRAPVVPLDAPTQRPDEPLTHGINAGPGAGSEALVLPNMGPSLVDTIKHLTQFDPSGDVELIYRQLTDNGF